VNDNINIDNKRWIGFAVAVLMSRTTGDHLSAFSYDVFPYDLATLIGPILGYGFTGILLGLCMFYLLGNKGKNFLKWLPLLLMSVVLLSAFLNLFSAGRVSDWSVFALLGLYLTRLSGYSYLFLLPFVSGMTMYFLEAKKNSSNVTVSGFKSWLKNALFE